MALSWDRIILQMKPKKIRKGLGNTKIKSFQWPWGSWGLGWNGAILLIKPKKTRMGIIMPFSFCITWDGTTFLMKQIKQERELIHPPKMAWKCLGIQSQKKQEREWWNKKLMALNWGGRTLGNKQK